MNEWDLAKLIHETRITYCWGKNYVGLRDKWPDHNDPKILRAYPHNPISYVDIALAQALAIIAAQQLVENK